MKGLKVRSVISFFTIMACVLANSTLTACFKNEEVLNLDNEPEFQTNVIANFKQGSYPELFAVADGFSNGGVFNVEWDDKAVKYTDDGLELTVSRKPENDQGNVPEVPNYGAGMNTHNYYGYGFYSAEMKPSGVDGTCTALFTYSGQYDTDAEGNPHPNPHDEIDIEFLGKDTTRVQFNYFVNGQGGHEYWYDLGFDASEEYHTYGFYWAADRITWYVDGEAVYKVEASESTPLPANPGRIMMNHWSGTEEAEGWMEKYDGQTSTASYRTISVTGKPLDVSGQEIVPETGDFELDATSVNLPLTSTGSGYKITTTDNGNSYDIAADGIVANSYENITNSSDISDLMAEKNAFAFTIENNGQKRLNVRLDVIDTTIETSNDDPSLPKHQCINYLAYKDNVKATTSYEWGGTTFVVEPNQTSEIVLIYKGTANKIALFLDSSLNSDETRTVRAKLSSFKFGVATGEDIPLPSEPVEDPFEAASPISLDFTEVSEGYNVIQNAEKTDLNVTYTDMTLSWNNVGANIAHTTVENAFSVKIKNNGDKEVAVRINVLAVTPPSEQNSAANVSATYNGVAVNTDMVWGGSFFTIPANSEGVAIVWFNSPIYQVQFMIDSFNEGTFSGNVTFSEFKLVEDPEGPAIQN